tara:strand:- start:7502 stop:8269 length:768 start_codon:yes stop_codon:yes gene_type:complete
MTRSKAQEIFGTNAEAYAQSSVHVRDDSLDIIENMLSGHYFKTSVDVGTGAGFTALSISRFSQTVIASDPTRPMLNQTIKACLYTNATNIFAIQNVAEKIPLMSDSIELVTCRKAGHHFPEFSQYIKECARILKPGGIMILADSISPEDDHLDHWLNEIEEERDPSHIRNRRISEINGLINEYGFNTQTSQLTRIHLVFSSWVGRTGVSKTFSEYLQQKFIKASPETQEAFQITFKDDDIHFSWPCVVMKCVKSV